jgi:uncharacterized membrane protein ArfC
MNTVNWWLMALAFVLGMLLTFVTMIRRVQREVPIQRAAAVAGVPGGQAAARFSSGRADSQAQSTERLATDGDSPSKLASAGAARWDGGQSATEPHTPVSVRAIPGGSAPAGYPIKANEDAMAYHTPGSPSFEHTIADIWFKDEPSAVGAGFTRWDKVGANEETTEMPAADDDSPTKLASAGAVGAAGATTQDKPYGVGSVRVAGRASAPQGYTVKGNENSMLYHTPDSPSYGQTIAEVWFKDEESAVHAGFTPWHKGRKTR